MLKVIIDPYKDLDLKSHVPLEIQTRLLLLERGIKFKNANKPSFIAKSIKPIPEGILTIEADFQTGNVIFTQTIEQDELDVTSPPRIMRRLNLKGRIL